MSKKPIEPDTEIVCTITDVGMANGVITFALPEEYEAAAIRHRVPGMSIDAAKEAGK